MKKKMIGAMLTVVLLGYFLAGCGGKSSEGNQLEKIRQAGKIVMGTEGTYAPVTYHDDNGDLVGSDVEIAEKVAEKLGVEIEFVESDWDSLLAALDSGRIDTMINSVSITDKRKEKYDFTDPYFSIQRIVVVKGDNEEIKSKEDLDGKIIATNLTNSFIPTLEECGASVVPIDTFEQSIELLESGRVDFLIPNEMVYYPYLDSHPDADVKIAFTWENSADVFGVPVKKGQPELLEALNQALDELKEEGVLSEISEKYYATDFSQAE